MVRSNSRLDYFALLADCTIIGLLRATNVLQHYRGFVMPEGDRFRAYTERVLRHPAFKRTCSTEQLYLDSYERYVIDQSCGEGGWFL